MKSRHFLWLLLALLQLPAALADTLLLAAGAGYRRPVGELAQRFETQSGVHVEQIYGNLGAVIAQARQSGQVALICGDLSYLEKVQGLAFTRFLALGDGRLVLAWRQGLALKAPAALGAADFARIAVPDGKAAIYGIAAGEFLQQSGLAAPLAGKLQVVATVPQISAYLISGEVDAGFINLTEALAIRDKIGGYLEIDPATYAPIHIVAGVVDGFATQPGLVRFGQFLETPEARAILKKHGL